MKDQEIRIFWQGELMCPNPVERYRMPRSFDDMKREYDLLNLGRVTDEEVMFLASKMTLTNRNWHYYAILGIEIASILFLVLK